MSKIISFFKDIQFLNFGKYFKYSLLKSIKSTIFILCIGFITCIIPLIIDKHNFKSTTNIGLVVTLSVILCYVIPVLKTDYIRSKRSVDLYYSLPITKTTLMLARFLTGLIQIFFIVTVLYFSSMAVAIMNIHTSLYNFVYYIPLYFILIGLIISLYSFIYFIVTRANSTKDAIFNIVAYTFIFLLIGTFIGEFTYSMFDKTLRIYMNFFPFSSFINTGNYYNYLIMKDTVYYVTSLGKYEIDLFLIIFNVILGIISFILLFVLTHFDKAENSEDINDSYFGYKTLLPAYLFLIVSLISADIDESIMFLILVFSAIFVAFKFVHYRKLKITKSLLIQLIVCVVLGIVVGQLLFGW